MSDIGRADREAREARGYDSPPYRVLVRRDYDLGADARETELNMIAELEGLGISPHCWNEGGVSGFPCFGSRWFRESDTDRYPVGLMTMLLPTGTRVVDLALCVPRFRRSKIGDLHH